MSLPVPPVPVRIPCPCTLVQGPREAQYEGVAAHTANGYGEPVHSIECDDVCRATFGQCPTCGSWSHEDDLEGGYCSDWCA